MSKIINVRTPDKILNEMVTLFQSLQPDVSVSEASTLYFLFQIFATHAANNMNTAEIFARAAFLTSAEGDDLTRLCADRGVDRREAEPATAILELSRAVADATTVTIPANSSFATDTDENGSRIIFKTLETVEISAGTTSVTGNAEAQTAGTESNVSADTIVNIVSNINGLDTVTNPASAYGGVDEESDELLRERTIDKLSNNTGKVTASGYRQTLESFSGVKSAIVQPASGSMPNHIDAIVTSTTTSDGIPTPTQLTEWETMINSDDNRAVVDVINVTAPTAVTVTVDATIDTYADNADPSTTRNRVQQSVIDFINDLDPGDVIRVVDIANIIHDDAGVKDFTLTNPPSNTTLTNTEKATASTSSVTIN